MVTTIVVTIPTKTNSIAVQDLVHPTASDAPITDAFRQLGIVTAIRIVTEAKTSPKINARRKIGPATEICLHVITAIVFHASMSATETMIVWTTPMSLKINNARLGLAMLTLNSLVKLIGNGDEPFVSRRIGSAMAIRIV